jgi:hypothetical protein
MITYAMWLMMKSNSSIKYAKPREPTQREKDISKEIGIEVIID